MMLGLGIGVYLAAAARALGFDPTGLFASGEQGIWLDPSDLMTLYQDSAGTTPVTAAGQPVGLVLDKSQGLVLGPDLVTNGDFSEGNTGWTNSSSGTGTATITTNAVLVGTNVSNRGRITQSQIMTAGVWYQLELDVTVTSGAFSVWVNGAVQGEGILVVANRSTSGKIKLAFRATVSGSRLLTVSTGASGGNITVYNISVRELPGFHATQPVASRRPTLIQDESGKYCLSFDGADDYLVTPTITPGTDKVQVFAGVRAIGTATGIVVENGDASTTNGTFALASPNAYLNLTHWSEMRGSTRLFSDTGTFPTIGPPRTDVVSFLYDIGGATPAAEMLPRLNGESKTLNVPTPPDNSAGTGNFLAYPLYIGSRGGTIYFFKGNLYSLITRFGPNLDEATIAKTEARLNTKTGAY